MARVDRLFANERVYLDNWCEKVLERGVGKTSCKKFSPRKSPLLFLHLSQIDEHREGEDDEGIAENPPEVREDAGIVACDDGALHFDGMDKREGVGNLFKSAAHEVKVEPNAREPCREIG